MTRHHRNHTVFFNQWSNYFYQNVAKGGGGALKLDRGDPGLSRHNYYLENTAESSQGGAMHFNLGGGSNNDSASSEYDYFENPDYCLESDDCLATNDDQCINFVHGQIKEYTSKETNNCYCKANLCLQK